MKNILVTILVLASLAFGTYHFLRTPVAIYKPEFSVFAVAPNSGGGYIALTTEKSADCKPEEGRAYTVHEDHVRVIEGCWSPGLGLVSIKWLDDGETVDYPGYGFINTPLGDAILACGRPQGISL